MKNRNCAKTQLFKVVGRKNGQQVEITEYPMTEERCWEWIKEQGIEKYYSNVCPVPYHGNELSVPC